jgi:hypothetical protein
MGICKNFSAKQRASLPLLAQLRAPWEPSFVGNDSLTIIAILCTTPHLDSSMSCFPYGRWLLPFAIPLIIGNPSFW